MTVKFPGNESDVEAALLLNAHVRESLNIAEQTEQALRLQIAHLEGLGEVAPWAVAHCIILTRIADDIRAAAGLVLRGYFPQAHAIGASVYELSYTAAFIGNNDQRASKWLEWSELDRTPWKRRKMVSAVRRSVYGPDAQIDDHGPYAALCWGKHGNPQLQKAGGVSSTPEAHVLNVDPSLGGKAHRFGELAIWLMLEPVITCLASFQRLGALPVEVLEAAGLLIEMWDPFDTRIWPKDSRT